MDMILSIEDKIENMRKELNLAGYVYGITSDIVLIKSKELDDLLNKYHKRDIIKSVAT
ncbi:aspartyl-phosphate phosphatase Spo0E family protein [Paenibacillus guangzhouensis]|uniref:aspartyl-phosphate phosphatase Spo0E family protein n=1 Tax=Paenibacillus guangzhouensis TaxID=1473112 RepID=UPI001D109AA2|nr:aspartyl-phosphate phosphatase Spo0E family protein [Paenibacillus guangzhouensis]